MKFICVGDVKYSEAAAIVEDDKMEDAFARIEPFAKELQWGKPWAISVLSLDELVKLLARKIAERD